MNGLLVGLRRRRARSLRRRRRRRATSVQLLLSKESNASIGVLRTEAPRPARTSGYAIAVP